MFNFKTRQSRRYRDIERGLVQLGRVPHEVDCRVGSRNDDPDEMRRLKSHAVGNVGDPSATRRKRLSRPRPHRFDPGREVAVNGQSRGRTNIEIGQVGESVRKLNLEGFNIRFRDRQRSLK